MIGARVGQSARDTHMYVLSLFHPFSFEAFVYQGGVDTSIISVDSGSEITVPVIPGVFIQRRSRVHAYACTRAHQPHVRVNKTYFYLNYRWESNIFDIINLCRLEWTRTGATFFLFLFLPIQLLLFLLCFFIFTPSKPSSFFLSSFCFLILLTHMITITRVPLVCVHFHNETSNLGRVMKKLSKREKRRETRIGDGGCTKSYISA